MFDGCSKEDYWSNVTYHHSNNGKWWSNFGKSFFCWHILFDDTSDRIDTCCTNFAFEIRSRFIEICSSSTAIIQIECIPFVLHSNKDNSLLLLLLLQMILLDIDILRRPKLEEIVLTKQWLSRHIPPLLYYQIERPSKATKFYITSNRLSWFRYLSIETIFT